AIEACGISTLSQSPMLGFHKQMDNRIKLLEEILSFRMQGVEFDNGDMYVDGHKAASDVRDEFVSVDRKSGSAGMPRPISYAVFCLKKKKRIIVQVLCRESNNISISSSMTITLSTLYSFSII